jgi:uncharacterized protein YoxC
MKRKSRLLSIFIMTILAVSLALPLVSVRAISTPTLSPIAPGPYQPGDVITVTGTGGDVTSGAEVRVYWDIASGANAWLLNTTEGKPNGSYECEVTVPEDVAGDHYIWVKDVETGATASSDVFQVESWLSVDPTFALPGDTITAMGAGFDAETEVWLAFFNLTYNQNLTTTPSTVETDEYGSFECTFKLPTVDYGDYTVNATDIANTAEADITTGASIKITNDEGPSGFVVAFTGRGFNESETVEFGEITWDNWSIPIVGDTIDVDSDGDLSGSVVAPTDTKGWHTLNVSDGTWWASDKFYIDGTTDVDVTPTFGPPGTTITITGANFTQIEGTDVTLTIGGTSLGTATTTADGTFTTTATAPAKAFGTYDIQAVDEYGLNETHAYKIGILAMLFYPTSGPSGTNVTITGTGFNDGGTFNVTIGDDLVLENEPIGGLVQGFETFINSFFVPTLDPGVYNIVVVDDIENEISDVFSVTSTTQLTASPSEAAVGYNVSLMGSGFTQENETTLTWYVYNSTWEKDISSRVNYTDSTVEVMVDEDGNFTGIWTVPATLLLGNTYTVNATDANELYAETTITIVEEEVDIHPNMGTYSLGDTITFTIKATFAKANSYLEIMDSNDELVFLSTFTAPEWTSVDPWKIVQIRNQVNDVTFNPFMIPTDSPIGTWTWTLYDSEDEVIANGTIEVIPTTAAQVDARLTDVESSLSNLADEVAQVSTDIADDIAGLSDEIAGVKDDLDTVKSDLASDIAEAKASADAAAAAVGDLEDTVSDIAATANSAKAAADSAKASADAAKDAADDAKTATSGLTTLVYGAIGASLIAALAAIVSLMQISRRIAG